MEDGPDGDACRLRVGEQIVRSLHGEWNSLGVDLGYRYDGSPIIVPDGAPPPADEVSDYEQTARPGHRAPHAWLGDGRSTLDLFGRGFTLLRFGALADETQAIAAAADAAGVPFRAVDIDDPKIATLYAKRLVLVRPDGQVAWRSDTAPEAPAHLIDVVRGAVPVSQDRTEPEMVQGAA